MNFIGISLSKKREGSKNSSRGSPNVLCVLKMNLRGVYSESEMEWMVKMKADELLILDKKNMDIYKK